MDSEVVTDVNVNSSRPKVYLYETGKVIYDIQSEAAIPPYFTSTTTGTKRFVFKDWGNIRIEEEETETTQVLTNTRTGEVTTHVTTEHKLKKWDTPKSYTVDFEEIRVLDFSSVQDLLSGEELVEAIAPDQTEPLSVEGVKIVALKSCTVQRVNELFTLCTHAEGLNTYGIHLESILYDPADLVSPVSTEKATSAHFDVFVDDSEFELPAFNTINGN